MIYEEHAVPAGLEHAVARIWFLETPRLRPYEKILPSPFAHAIVNLSDPYSVIDADGTATAVEDAFVSGVQTGYLVIASPPVIRHLGIEFRPGGLSALTDAPAATMADRVLGASTAVPELAALARLARAETVPGAGLTRVAEALAARRDRVGPDRLVVEALAAMEADPGRTVGSIADALGVSHRTFIARFRRSVGLAPKAYAQVWRFHRFVAALQPLAREPDWAVLAADGGYYDQPHVIRAFRRFSGWTPREYARQVAEFGPDEANFVPLDDVPSVRRDGVPSFPPEGTPG